MKNRSLLIFVALLLLPLVSCDKAKNKKWLFADIEVRDAHSNELISSEVDLYFRYYDKTYEETEFEIEPLESTIDGLFTLEKKFPEKIKEAYVVARANGYYYNEGDFQSTSDFQNLNVFKRNELTILLNPIYRFQLAFKNVNCFDANDSFHFYVSDPNHPYDFSETLTGCFDGTLPNLPTWTLTSYVNWIGYLERNGVETTLQTPYPLAPNTINQVVIEY